MPCPGRHQSVPPPTHPAFPGRAARVRPSVRADRRGAAISASTSSSSASIASWAMTARSARSASTPRAAPLRTSSTNASGSCPVAARYCSSPTFWCESRCARSSTRRRVSLSTSDCGRFDRHEIGGSFEHLVAHGHLRLQLLHHLEPPAHVVAQLVDGVELARFVDPLVGEVGQDLLLRFLDDDAERRLLRRRARRSAREASR